MASAVVGNLKVLLTADTAAFDKAMKGADASTQKLANTMKRDLAPSQTQINKLVRDFAGSQEIGNAIKYAKAIEQVGGAARLTASEQARANKALQEGVAKLAALGPEFQKLNPHMAASIAKVKEFAAATTATKQSTASFGSAITAMKGVMGAFGVTMGAAGLINFGKQVFDNADKIGDLALKMGISTDAAQRFQYAARQSGAEIEDVSAALVKMNDNLAEGDKSTIAALEAAGLNFQKIRNMKPEDAFRAITDAIGRMSDPMKQTQVGMDLFGKSFATILPMIKENSLAAADAIDVMTKDQIEDLKDAQQAWENFFNFLVSKSGVALAEVARTMANISALATGNLDKLKVPGEIQKPGFAGVLTMPLAAKYWFDRAIAPLADRGKTVKDAMASMPTVAGPSLFNPATDEKLKQAGATVATTIQRAQDLKDGQAALDKFREAVEKLTGKQLTQDLKEFEKQFAAAMKAGGIHKTQIEATAKSIEMFISAGLNISPAMMSWYTTAAMNAVLGNNEKLQQSFLKTAISAQVLDRQARTSIAGLVKPTDWGGLMGGAMSVSDLMGQTNTKGQSLGQLFGAGMTDFTGDMSGKIMRAITGGGDIGKTLGSLFGTSILGKMTGTMGKNGLFDQGLGKMLQGSFLGKKIGGFVGSMIPGIGALLGPAMSALFGKISGIGKNNTLKERQSFAGQMGFDNLNALLDNLASSPEGKRLADQAMRGIGKGDTKANEKWMKDVQALFDKQAKTTAAVTDNIGKLQSALERFGGVAPKSLRPFIDDLLKSNKLTADQRMALEAMGKAPTWQTIQARAEALGIDMGALGGNFNAARIKDMGFGLFHDIEMFLEQGADRDGVLRGMADELSALAAEAIKTNKPLPKVLEQYFRRLQEMGLLVDEQGNAIMEGLVFQDMVDESLQQVVSVLEEIRDLLAGRAPGAGPAPSPGAGSGGGELGPKVPEEPTYRNPGDDWREGPRIEMPGFAGGTHGAYQDFGAGTPVMLHGKERVMTEAEGRMASAGMMTVIVEADGRQLSRLTTPYIPGETKRLGLNRV